MYINFLCLFAANELPSTWFCCLACQCSSLKDCQCQKCRPFTLHFFLFVCFTGNALEVALQKINREDVVRKCMYNVEVVDDEVEAAAARVAMDQSGEHESG